ncbi:MAG: MoxR family ATPase [Methanothrix sp.]|uniref:ATPase associated with various cellular activitie n=1 Tax=Methanothrix harundinacea TaxID=301375 RepID=A0A117LGA1_9EURY|nr:MAG: ATPase associated with various cellular activitie [Methanothrix harundinacea]MDD2638416.1 MoxR family ATPase [Methanothrix sp.]MDI9398118.1 MoxR family ATPase [Euryarchaeota archaeon]KUK96502.1 MAG: ATPase associated with various cellular activitie [Methanothrix harundinacea]MCP1392373.1 MoxR family ATPase [Methanothrix harundinacea]
MRDDLINVYKDAPAIFETIKGEIGKVVVGQKSVVEQILVGILAGGHTLLESNPGLGKTLLVKTIASTTGLDFSRIQCTPDLMPADITGTTLIEEVEGSKVFRFEEGPIFANIVLADEINRASPRTQSAMLEAMQEKQVTVGKNTYKLEEPFFVLATQNPIEMEGTFPLPEAQLDRFLLKVFIDYPSPEEEYEIMERYTGHSEPKVERVITRRELLSLQQLTRDVPISDDLKRGAIKVVISTRSWEGVEYGVSPRASIGMILASKARALLNGRDYVSREDLETMAYPILRHRIILTFDSERRGVTTDQVISDILKSI